MERRIFSPVDVAARRALDLRPGDTVRVYQRIEEKGKTRLQVFEGVVLARKHGREAGGTVTVRRVVGGVGVEKIFPIYSPSIEKFDVVRRAKVRRAKLYYIRKKAAREIKRQMQKTIALADRAAAREREDKSPATAEEGEKAVETK